MWDGIAYDVSDLKWITFACWCYIAVHFSSGRYGYLLCPLCMVVGLWPISNLPDWASPRNWLGPEGHADFKKSCNVDDPSLCNLCSFPLKLFKDETEIMSSLNEFHLLSVLSEKKCCLRSVITRFYVTSESVLLFFRCDWVQKNVLNMTADNPWIIL